MISRGGVEVVLRWGKYLYSHRGVDERDSEVKIFGLGPRLEERVGR